MAMLAAAELLAIAVLLPNRGIALVRDIALTAAVIAQEAAFRIAAVADVPAARLVRLAGHVSNLF